MLYYKYVYVTYNYVFVVCIIYALCILRNILLTLYVYLYYTTFAIKA